MLKLDGADQVVTLGSAWSRAARRQDGTFCGVRLKLSVDKRRLVVQWF